jgi:hypothetical protein
MTTKAAKQQAVEQALASAALEGHTPTFAFLADAQAVINGTMTPEQARARSLERALVDTKEREYADRLNAA